MGLRSLIRDQPARLRRLDRVAAWASLCLLLSLVIRQGFRIEGQLHLPVSFALAISLIMITAVRLVLDALVGGRVISFLRSHAPDLILLVLLLIPPWGVRSVGFLIAIRVLSRLANRSLLSGRGRSFVVEVRRRPAILIAGTFLLLIAVGTLFLSFPGARAPGTPNSLLTALFTAASAACVTGLVVVDTATYWSSYGQWVILALIQLGGLGIMSLSASAMLVLGRGLGSGPRDVLSGILEETAERDVKHLLQFLVAFTFLTEAIGALLLGLRWAEVMPPGEAWSRAVFHSVSAFCNAGFSTFPDNLEHWATDLTVNGVVAGLVFLGGIGFPVAAGLFQFPRRVRHPRRWWGHLPSHARLVLVVNFWLLAGGTLLILVLEYEGALSGLGPGGKLVAAAFQSVSLRTAGFNTVPLAGIAPATAVFMMFWMFVGGSPGGTAGGIKTTTLAVLAMSVSSTVRRRPDVEIFARRVPEETVLRAAATVLLAAAVVLVSAILLLTIESHQAPVVLLFETVSAFGTVGLSLGATPALTPAGRLLIILLMFIGRTGPLTFAFILGRSRRRFYRYPEARILVG